MISLNARWTLLQNFLMRGSLISLSPGSRIRLLALIWNGGFKISKAIAVLDSNKWRLIYYPYRLCLPSELERVFSGGRRTIRWDTARLSVDNIEQVVIIDFSENERGAIILFCIWHLHRAWDKQIKEKVKGDLVLRRKIKGDLMDLKSANTVEFFEEKWQNFKAKYGRQTSENNTSDLVEYVANYWYPKRAHWAECYRSANGLIETNNYIESWHSVLKRSYIGDTRLRRHDYSISLIFEEDIHQDNIEKADPTMEEIWSDILCTTNQVNKEDGSGSKSITSDLIVD
ncbi:hypothetical protein V1509DRAFT_611100 [Lipomyces kononenkoae]